MAVKSTEIKKKIITVGGRTIDFNVPKVMGILNTTPDSFFAGSRISSVEHALKASRQMIAEGADFIDIGAYSSRPGAIDISEKEEAGRLLPIVKAILKEFPEAILSIDTFRSEIAEAAISEGAHIINDISAGELDDKMIDTISRLKVPYIIMHMRGNPQTMKGLADYENVVDEVYNYLSTKLLILQEKGIRDIVIDPGFGFAKTIEHNYEILNSFERFTSLGYPILAGLSRKSMIWKVLEVPNEEALNGTTVLNTIALIKGANILRVHDVKAAVEAVKLLEKMKS